MKRLPIVITMVVAGSFLAFQTLGKSNGNPPPSKYDEILRLVGQKLSEDHYSPQNFDDAFSKKVFKKYLTQIDPDKTFFLQSDIDQLKQKYENHIDDEIKGAPVEFFLEAGKIFNTRMEENAKICAGILSKPFDFNVDEDVNLDGDKINYTTTDAERQERWRKKLKYLALERYSDLLDMREKNKGKEGFEVKTDAQLEQEARDKVKKLMDRTFDRYRFKFNDDDKFNLFVNAITTTMDPHTEFFPPVDKRYFDEEMSGRFFGIGASLTSNDDGNIKISSVITGSPAWKSGEIQVGDVVLKVGQGNQEPTDLTGYDVTDAVKLIRGQKGTEVRLTLKKADGALKVVSLIRDEIVQDETFARSAVVKNGDEKIGYIFLPEFYADFDHPNGNRCSIDVAKEVIKLKEQNVDGIVIDLRYNGGGSLYDVVQMAGLFVDDGPIVQVKDRDNRASVLRDKDHGVLYSGPLAVMVNEFSASASEIFAAAIQDYNRGVIIGSTSTYGKGTVQRNIPVGDDGIFALSSPDLGTVKLTLQKFYRINGGSTQLDGVKSDVVLPDNLEYLKVREKDDPDALPWDEIAKSNYTPWNPGYDLKTIEQLSKERLANNPAFKTIQENSEWLAKENDKNYSLQLEKYRNEQKKINSTVKQIESLMKLKDSLSVSPLPDEANRWAKDKDKQQRYDQWLKGLRTDIYLDQAVKVMGDMISQQNLAKAKQTDSNKKAF
ncbi:MAG TPA: carboxy terminal-processing peptidase [Chitinophagaceae bacterium]|nr:carboxy terminal-processing peptidase [Chitinophagaceae bacterium]